MKFHLPVIVICVLCLHLGCASHIEDVDLIQFGTSNGFSYGSFQWNASVDDIENILGISLEGRSPLNSDEWTIYNQVYDVSLCGLNGTATYEFFNGKLRIIKFTFKDKSSHDQDEILAFYHEVANQLTLLYGDCTKETVTEEEALGSIIISRTIRWDSPSVDDSHTTLQLTYITRNSDQPVVILGVGLIVS